MLTYGQYITRNKVKVCSIGFRTHVQYDASMHCLTYTYMKYFDFIFIHEFNYMSPLQPLLWSV